jgi:hypothetical protein
MGRRTCEHWANGEVWVSNPGDVGGAETLGAARDGLDGSGEEIAPGVRLRLIAHAEFEAVRERYAIPYLHHAAGLGRAKQCCGALEPCSHLQILLIW